MKPVLLLLALCALSAAVSESSADSGFGHYGFGSLQFRLGADTYAELRKAPEKATSRANPLENDPDAFAAGRILFEDHCAECHGDNAEGGRKAPSLRESDVRDATPGTLFWLLTNGVVRKKMPAWSKLPEPQRWQLVRFLKSVEAPKFSESVNKR
jgi:mono/diheme cytochrome c family protein